METSGNLLSEKYGHPEGKRNVIFEVTVSLLDLFKSCFMK